MTSTNLKEYVSPNWESIADVSDEELRKTIDLDKDEFPPIGAERTSEPKSGSKSEVKPRRKQQRCNRQMLVIPVRSRIADLKEDEQRRRSSSSSRGSYHNSSRSAALNHLADLAKPGASKGDRTNTRLCRSLPGTCHRGPECPFAHSVEDLKLHPCAFGGGCRFVEKTEGGVVNKGTKLCLFLHPDEDRKACLERTGLGEIKRHNSERKKTIDLVPRNVTVRTSLREPRREEPRREEPRREEPRRDELRHGGASSAAPVLEAWKNESVQRFQVPESFAHQALEMGIKAGHKSILIEIAPMH